STPLGRSEGIGHGIRRLVVPFLPGESSAVPILDRAPAREISTREKAGGRRHGGRLRGGGHLFAAARGGEAGPRRNRGESRGAAALPGGSAGDRSAPPSARRAHL